MIENNDSSSIQNPDKSPQIIFATKIKLPHYDELQLAYENTFVMKDGEILRHVNKEGRKISEIKVRGAEKFVMLSEDQVVILCNNLVDRFFGLTCWNLKMKINSTWQCAFAFEKNQLLDIMYFNNTQILCVCEANIQSGTFNLSYFRLPLKTKIPFHTAKLQFHTQKHLQIKKLNQHSMVGFVPVQFKILDKDIYFYSYNLKGEEQMEQGVQIQHVFQQWLQYGVKTHGNITLMDIFQMEAMVFYIQIKVVHQDLETKFHNLYWNHTTQNLQISKITFPHDHRLQYLSNLRQIPTKTTKTIYQNLKPRILTTNVPIYYLQPKTSTKTQTQTQTQTQKIICLHPLKNKTKQNIIYPSYKSDRILQYYLNQGKETLIDVLRVPGEWGIYGVGLGGVCGFFLEEVMMGVGDEGDGDLVKRVVGLVLGQEKGEFL